MGWKKGEDTLSAVQVADGTLLSSACRVGSRKHEVMKHGRGKQINNGVPTCIASDILFSRRRERLCELVNLVLDRRGG